MSSNVYLCTYPGPNQSLCMTFRCSSFHLKSSFNLKYSPHFPWFFITQNHWKSSGQLFWKKCPLFWSGLTVSSRVFGQVFPGRTPLRNGVLCTTLRVAAPRLALPTLTILSFFSLLLVSHPEGNIRRLKGVLFNGNCGGQKTIDYNFQSAKEKMAIKGELYCQLKYHSPIKAKWHLSQNYYFRIR